MKNKPLLRKVFPENCTALPQKTFKVFVLFKDCQKCALYEILLHQSKRKYRLKRFQAKTVCSLLLVKIKLNLNFQSSEKAPRVLKLKHCSNGNHERVHFSEQR